MSKSGTKVSKESNDQLLQLGLQDAQNKMPEDWKTLKTQVGGHQFENGDKHGMVDLGNGFVLKSLQNPPRGVRELNFYQKVFDPDSTDVDLIELRDFMPDFHGMLENNGRKFLKLANLTFGYKNPCVIDLKMGQVTYDQDAPPEKKASEIAKYPPLEKLGFQITGMMFYNPVTDTCEKFDKNFGKSLTEETIITKGLDKFFRQGQGELRNDALQPVLSKLLKLESWFMKQKKYSFIASSLFMVYEGSKVEGQITKCKHIQKDSTHNSEDMMKEDSTLKPVEQQVDNKNSERNKEKGISLKRHNQSEKTVSTTAKKAKLDNNRVEIQNDQTELSNSKNIADVHLIDFAHAFPALGTDTNFLFGLQKLIGILKKLPK